MYKEITKINWQYFFLSLIAILIPCGINLLPLIILWVLFWIYTGEYKCFNLKQSISWFSIFILFFIINLIGVFYSKNIAGAMSLVQAKIVFLFIPVLLNTYKIKKEQLKVILLGFCFSNFFVSVYLIGRALFFAVTLHDPICTYSRFSIFTHPSYASLYMVFSIAVLFLAGFRLSTEQRKDFIIKSSISFILVIAVLFCSSKIGFITLILLLFLLTVHFILKLKRIYHAIIFFGFLFSTFFIFIENVPGPMGRLNNVIFDYKNINDISLSNMEDIKARTIVKGINQRESTMARIFIWNSSVQVMKDNLFFGAGTGDVNDELLFSFERNHLYNFLNKGLNAHNQYIETQIAVGLPGLFILIILTIGAFIYGLFKRNLLLCIFLALLIFNFLVESMLNIQGPSLFFSLFFFLLVELNLADKRENMDKIKAMQITPSQISSQ